MYTCVHNRCGHRIEPRPLCHEVAAPRRAAEQLLIATPVHTYMHIGTLAMEIGVFGGLITPAFSLSLSLPVYQVSCFALYTWI